MTTRRRLAFALAGAGLLAAPGPDAATQLRAELARHRAAREALAAEVADLRDLLRRLERGGARRGPAPSDLAEPEGDPLVSTPADIEALMQESREGLRMREESLVRAGLAPDEVAQLRSRFETWEVARLQAVDRAIRAGQTRGLLHILPELDAALRAELGEERYDLMLFAGGTPNRVHVAELFQGSAAQAAGIRDGDLIRRYAGRAVYVPADVRRLAAEARPGACVPVQIERLDSDRLIDRCVEPGQLGVALQGVRVRPRRLSERAP